MASKSNDDAQLVGKQVEKSDVGANLEQRQEIVDNLPSVKTVLDVKTIAKMFMENRDLFCGRQNEQGEVDTEGLEKEFRQIIDTLAATDDELVDYDAVVERLIIKYLPKPTENDGMAANLEHHKEIVDYLPRINTKIDVKAIVQQFMDHRGSFCGRQNEDVEVDTEALEKELRQIIDKMVATTDDGIVYFEEVIEELAKMHLPSKPDEN